MKQQAKQQTSSHWHRHSSYKLFFLSSLITIFSIVTFTISYFLASQGSLASVYVGHTQIDKHMNKAKVRRQLAKEFKNYQLIVVDNDKKTFSYALADAGLKLLAEKSVQQALAYQESLSFFKKIAFWERHYSPIVFSKDDDTLFVFISTKLTRYIAPAKNALVYFDNNNLRVAPDTAGEAYTIAQPEKTLMRAAQYLEPSRITLTRQKVSPPVTLQDAEELVGDARKLAKTPVSFQVKDQTVTPDQPTILSWVEPVTETTVKAKLEINSGKIQEYIDKITAPYVREPENEVAITSSGFKTVLVPGRTGSAVIDKEKVVKAIHDQLLKQKPISQQLTISEATFTSTATKTYPKWLVVDITNKTIDAYEYNSRVNRLLVSAGRPDTPTPTGQYRIYLKRRTQDMRGANADGTNYFQPNVEWINYFYSDYAVHGNYWRPESYFGNVNSSHGCVGLRNNDAAWVYNWAPIGTPVIVHR